MSLSSGVYLLFLAAVVVLYFLVPAKLRVAALAAGCILFLIKTSINALFAVFLTALLCYAGGLLLGKLQKNRVLLAFLLVCLAAPLVIVRTGHADLFPGGVPVGLSFYMLAAMGYLIDCFLGKTRPERNLLNLAVFLGFFPVVTSGPIERASTLLAQLRELGNRKRSELFSLTLLQRGGILIIWGLFLKLVLADRLGILVDNVYAGADHYGTGILLAGAFGFSLQLYCDFCGYSSIACGSAMLLGISLTDNFSAPYLAASPGEFWERWHISLSRWLRDYIYIPLGGNRKGKLRRYINIFITFLVSGLWHGTGLSFIVWGLLHACYQTGYDLIKGGRKDREVKSFASRIPAVIVTFLLVTLAWIFFRADSTMQALMICRRIVTVPDLWVITAGGLYGLGLHTWELFVLFISLAILLVFDIVTVRTGKRIDMFLTEQNMALRLICVLFMVFMTMYFGIYGPGSGLDAAFLYGQF